MSDFYVGQWVQLANRHVRLGRPIGVVTAVRPTGDVVVTWTEGYPSGWSPENWAVRSRLLMPLPRLPLFEEVEASAR